MKNYQQLAAFTLDYNTCILNERYETANDINREMSYLERTLGCDLYHVSVQEKECTSQKLVISGTWYQDGTSGYYTATVSSTFEGFEVDVACDNENLEHLLEVKLHESLDMEYDG